MTDPDDDRGELLHDTRCCGVGADGIACSATAPASAVTPAEYRHGTWLCESCYQRAGEEADERAMEGPSRPVYRTREELIAGKR